MRRGKNMSVVVEFERDYKNGLRCYKLGRGQV